MEVLCVHKINIVAWDKNSSITFGCHHVRTRPSTSGHLTGRVDVEHGEARLGLWLRCWRGAALLQPSVQVLRQRCCCCCCATQPAAAAAAAGAL